MIGGLLSYYSNDDKFSRGVSLILFIPLVIPHLYLHSKDSSIYLIILIVFFFISVYLDWKNLHKLYVNGGDSKNYVALVIITTLLNFILSFYLNENKWLIIVLSLWCLYLGLKAAKMYKKYLSI